MTSLFFSASSLKVEAMERAKLHPWEVKKKKKMLRTDKKKKNRVSACRAPYLFVVRRIEKVLIWAHEGEAGKKKKAKERTDKKEGRGLTDGNKRKSEIKRGEKLRSWIFCRGSNCVRSSARLWKAATEKQMFASAPFFLRLQITEIAAEIVDRVCQGWQLQEPTDLGWFFSFFIFFFFFFYLLKDIEYLCGHLLF